MNMVFIAFTMWKNHHLVLPTKKLVSLSLVPLNLHYDQFIIWRTLQIQANCSFYCVKLLPLKRSNFNVQTMNMAFNAVTMWKNHHLVLPTNKLFPLSLIPLNLLYDWFIIWRTLQIQANCSFYCVKLVPSKRSNFTKSWFNIFKVVPSFTPYLVVKYCLRLLGYYTK